jgi:hypothetical protein
VWRYGHEDPYRFYNRLDADYYPLGLNEFEKWTSEPLPPPEPRRLRNVIYGFAIFAEQQELERVSILSGGGAMQAAGG